MKSESTTAEKRPLSPVEANDEEDDDEESDYVVEEITAVRSRKGGEKEYLVTWAPPHNEEETWLPRAKLEASAPDKLQEFRLLRDPEEVAAEEAAAAAAAAAAKEKQASAAAAAEASKAATLEKQRRLREGWGGSIGEVIALLKQRLELLELKGKRVECPPVAPPEVLAELHDSLRALDPSYDPKYCRTRNCRRCQSSRSC